MVVSAMASARLVFHVFIFLSVVYYTQLVQASEVLSQVIFLGKVGAALIFSMLCFFAGGGKARYYILLSSMALFFLFSFEKIFPYFLFFLMATALSQFKVAEVKTVFLQAADLVFILCILIIFMALLGLIESKEYINTSGYAQEMRSSLGFYNPNPASLLILSSCLVYFFIGTVWRLFFAILFFAIVQSWLFSRTYIFIGGGVLLLAFVRYLRIGYILNIATFILLLCPVFLVLYFYDYRPLFIGGVDINAFFSNRIYVISQSFKSRDGLGLLPSSDFITIDPGLINFIGGAGLLLYFIFFLMLVFALLISRCSTFSMLAFAFILVNFSENIFSPYNIFSLLFFTFFIYILMGKRNAFAAS